MSDHRAPRRRNRILGQFSARTVEMLESPAYRVLSLGARRVLDRIEIELAHHGGNDNGRLPVTFDQFVEYGMNRHTVAPAIREVCALGFVEVTERGFAGNAEFRRANRFRLTYRHFGNAKPTDEWRAITTTEVAEMTACRARQARAPGRRSRRSQKQNASAGKRPTPVRVFPHRKLNVPVRFFRTTVLVRFYALPLYLGVLGHSLASTCLGTHPENGSSRPARFARHAEPRRFGAQPGERRTPTEWRRL
jgi:hypothetical protein